MKSSGPAGKRWQALRKTTDGEPSALGSYVRLGWHARELRALFRCQFRTLTSVGAFHDDDLWTGDVVELFVAPDSSDRRIYYEIEVNPEGQVFDARVSSPNLNRRTMTVDRSWNPSGLIVRSRFVPSRDSFGGIWMVRISLPLAEMPEWTKELTAGPAVGVFRIDRRSTFEPLFLALVPGFESPPDFHDPSRFVPLAGSSLPL